MTKIKDTTSSIGTDWDYESGSIDTTGIAVKEKRSAWHYLRFLFAGIVFGIILVKSEVVSWFRIQEMFRLQSFHMFGVIGSAIAVGMVSVWLIRKYKIRTITGEPIIFAKREFNKGTIYGGLIFGVGWAVTGACPGPLFAQIGAGTTVIVVVLLSAIIGTWVYGRFIHQLPH